MIIYEKTKRFKKRWQNLLRFKTDILRFRFAAEGLAFGSTSASDLTLVFLLPPTLFCERFVPEELLAVKRALLPFFWRSIQCLNLLHQFTLNILQHIS